MEKHDVTLVEPPSNVTPFPTPDMDYLSTPGMEELTEAPAPLPPATTEQTVEYLRNLETQLTHYLTSVRVTLMVLGA